MVVCIKFEFTTRYGDYKDALHLPDNHGLTNLEIDAIKQQRLDTWIEAIENPSPLEIENSIVVTVNDETYTLLEGIPPSGAILLEVDGNWYFRI